MSSDTLLSIRGVSVSIKGSSILHDVSLDVALGSIVGLFGDSGSGKTTLIHAVTGLLDSRYRLTGTVRFLGSEIQDLSPEERSLKGIGIVLQDLGLFTDRSVYENIAYPLYRRGVAEAEIEGAVSRVLGTFRISQLQERRIDEISGGQRQRVALARSLVYEPKLLLLDEPLRGLQDELRLQFLALVEEIKQSGTTVVLVTHDRSELQVVADTVVLLSEGRIESIEETQKGRVPEALTETVPIPHPDDSSRTVLATMPSLSRLLPEQVSQNFEVVDWRTLEAGRVAAFARSSSGVGTWIIFDEENVDEQQRRTGPCCIYYLVKGERHE